MSSKAKRILYALFFVFLLNFVLFIVRWQMTGDSGATPGKAENGGYRLVEHGRIIHVSRGEYLLSRVQIMSLGVCFVAVFITRAYFCRTGDLKRLDSTASSNAKQ